MNMKKIVSILTVAVLLVACMSVSVFAANAPVVTAEEVNAEMGKTVEVKVSISEATFASYGLKLTYDTDALTLVEIKQGERSQGMFSAKAESGKVGLVNTADTTGAGVLFTAVFEAKAPGKHEVKVEVDSFAKADTSILEVEVDNGFVNVVQPVPFVYDIEPGVLPPCVQYNLFTVEKKELCAVVPYVYY